MGSPPDFWHPSLVQQPGEDLHQWVAESVGHVMEDFAPDSVWSQCRRRVKFLQFLFNSLRCKLNICHWSVTIILRLDMERVIIFLHKYTTKIYIKFLSHALSHEVRTVSMLVARNMRTTTTKNLDLVRKETNIDPWTAKSLTVKHQLKL